MEAAFGGGIMAAVDFGMIVNRQTEMRAFRRVTGKQFTYGAIRNKLGYWA